MSILSNGLLTARMMYFCLLQRYHDATGDLEGGRRNFPFARGIFDRVRCGALTPDAAPVKGSSLFRDFPALLRGTGNDFSLMNNMFWDCGGRAADRMASLVGDEATSAMARHDASAIAQRFCETFMARYYGFPVSSLDATTLVSFDAQFQTAAFEARLDPEQPVHVEVFT